MRWQNMGRVFLFVGLMTVVSLTTSPGQADAYQYLALSRSGLLKIQPINPFSTFFPALAPPVSVPRLAQAIPETTIPKKAPPALPELRPAVLGASTVSEDEVLAIVQRSLAGLSVPAPVQRVTNTYISNNSSSDGLADSVGKISSTLTSRLDTILSAPSISSASFSGNTNFDSGTLFVSASNDRLGIGSTTPFARLSLDAEAGEYPFMVGSSTATLLSLNPAGYLGIGTTDPTAKLSIKESANGAGDDIVRFLGNGNNAAGTTLGAIEFFNNDTSGSGPNIPVAIKAFSNNSTGAGGLLAFYTHPQGSVEGEYGIEAMRITSDGLVGIGSNNPSNVLELYSATKAGIGFSGATDSTFKWTVGIDMTAGVGRFVIASSTNLGLNERLVILGNGNVGIGATNPAYNLDIGGTTGLRSAVTLWGLGNGAGTAYLCTTLATGVVSTSTSACNPSSLKYKENVANLSYGLSDVLRLRPVSYDYKPELLVPGHQVGFIAEEMYNVIPEVVGLKDGEPDNIDYAKLTAVLAKATQELSHKVDTISGTVSNLVLESLSSHVIYTQELHVDGNVCVDDICVTKEQFKDLLIGAGGTSSSGGPGGNDEESSSTIPE